MRVALVVPGGVDRGGVDRVIPALLALIERVARVHEVEVVALRQDPRPARWPLLGATVHNIGEGGTSRRAVMRLLSLHRRRKLDVLHAFWANGPGLVAAAAGRWMRRPVIVHLAGGELASLPEIGYGGRRTRGGRVRGWLALRGAAVRTAPSQALCDRAAALGFPTRRLPLGVDRRSWLPCPPRPRPPERAARLVHVASLNAVKDQDTLLRAAARLLAAGVPFTLDIVGMDTLDGAVQRRAAALGLERHARFHGLLPQHELRPLLLEADALVHSSRHEAGPIVLAEAALAGVPTVGTAVGQIAEWAPDAALAVPVGDDRALAAEIRLLLEDDARRIAVARAAQRRAMEEDADYTAGRVLGIYRELSRA